MKGNGIQKSRLWRLVIPLSAAGLVWAVSLHAAGTGKYAGDVNVDKSIDVADSVLLARFLSEEKLALVTDEGMKNADANDDGGISQEDLVYIMQMIAKKIPMPTPPWNTKEPDETAVTTADTTTAATTALTTVTAQTTETVTTTATAETTVTETTTETTESTALPTETAAAETTTETTQPASAGIYFTADSVSFPLGDSVSVLTGEKAPNEMLTVNYKKGNITFAIYADEPSDTSIAVAYQDNIVGYYKICSEYDVPEGYTVREYRDGFQNDVLYAVLVMRKDVSIDFMYLAEKNDMQVLSKLNYYASNGVRGLHGLEPLMWDEELAKLALSHCRDMTEHNFFGHNSSDGKTPQQRIEAAFGDEWQSFAENVDAGYINPFDALNGWYNSEGHRKNLLKDKLKRLGVAFAFGSGTEYRYYGTQDFVTFWDD